jgi:hypothetical protein
MIQEMIDRYHEAREARDSDLAEALREILAGYNINTDRLHPASRYD